MRRLFAGVHVDNHIALEFYAAAATATAPRSTWPTWRTCPADDRGVEACWRCHDAAVKAVFERDVGVHYGFVYLDSGVEGWDQGGEQRAGQRNGLLGAAQPGFLYITTGMHTGLVPFRVEAHEVAPAIDGSCGEIVEASCDLRGPEITLSTFDGAAAFVLPRNGPHRVRLSARDFEAGREQERYEPDEPVRDSYLVQMWPAPMAPDEILKVTSPAAAYWHEVALQHPTPPPSPHERALAEQRDREQAVDQQRAADREAFLQRWGGRDPSPRLLEVEEHARVLCPERRDLVDALAALTPDRQRALAVDLARQACDADDGPLDWRPALLALAAGQPLPTPFNDSQAVFDRMFPRSGGATATFSYVGSYLPLVPTSRQPLHTGVAADATVRAAAAHDPLEAALQAVNAASWSAPDLDAYWGDISSRVAGAGAAGT